MDFNEQIDRRQTDSIKWDTAETVFDTKDILPMWIADMDFASPQPIKEALKKVIEEEILGYSYPGDSLLNAIRNWQKDKHNMLIEKDHILLSPGVLSSIAVTIAALTEPGDSVLIHDPVYPPFYAMPEKNNRQIYRSPLIISDGRYEMDFDNIEQQFKEKNIKLFILSQPHNPGGRIWSKEELVRLTDLCIHYGVTLISDEIHSDLVYSGNTCISPVTIDETYKDWIVTLHSATKTFNIAGVKASFMIVFNKKLRDQIVKVQEETELGIVNTFGMRATEAAFSDSREWHEALLLKLEANRDIVTAYFDENLPSISYMKPESTYLFWFNASQLGVEHDVLRKTFAKIGKIGLNDGISYGPSGGAYMRLNFAVPESLLMEGLDRIKLVFDHFNK
ncbi:MalY/PatB family protein [Alkalibacterium kapii]|uniref:cysteine-S-conjugate beta-lyase n=1 Tax=Alkalibacterium kapii TaxID=426704 RepID=A0A511B2U1_9LACT|nr:MalY/PatB family protein [Alkalibacterium kapii]GEK92127.1 cysteine desulfhydrase [Alkalibacterium kapii]